MSKKKDEKQKETNQEIDKKEVGEEVSEKTKSKESIQAEDKSTELEKMKEEVISLKRDKLILAAELENKRKDFQQQIEQVYKYSNKKFISWVIDFLVDLEEKALKAMREDSESKVKNHLLGIEMMRNILWKNLENEGVKEIKENRWSSRLHELVEEVEDDNLPEGTVVKVLEKGYILVDQVLRPAKVIISKKSKKEKNQPIN